MHEDTEDKMFKDLLADYAEPADDNGFSDQVLAGLSPRADHSRLKTLMVGGAGLVGAAIAGLQLPALWTFLTGINVPEIQPISAPQVDASLFSSTYGMMSIAMIVLLLFWIGNNVVFGEDM